MRAVRIALVWMAVVGVLSAAAIVGERLEVRATQLDPDGRTRIAVAHADGAAPQTLTAERGRIEYPLTAAAHGPASLAVGVVVDTSGAPEQVRARAAAAVRFLLGAPDAAVVVAGGDPASVSQPMTRAEALSALAALEPTTVSTPADAAARAREVVAPWLRSAVAVVGAPQPLAEPVEGSPASRVTTVVAENPVEDGALRDLALALERERVVEVPAAAPGTITLVSDAGAEATVPMEPAAAAAGAPSSPGTVADPGDPPAATAVPAPLAVGLGGLNLLVFVASLLLLRGAPRDRGRRVRSGRARRVRTSGARGSARPAPIASLVAAGRSARQAVAALGRRVGGAVLGVASRAAAGVGRALGAIADGGRGAWRSSRRAGAAVTAGARRSLSRLAAAVAGSGRRVYRTIAGAAGLLRRAGAGVGGAAAGLGRRVASAVGGVASGGRRVAFAAVGGVTTGGRRAAVAVAGVAGGRRRPRRPRASVERPAPPDTAPTEAAVAEAEPSGGTAPTDDRASVPRSVHRHGPTSESEPAPTAARPVPAAIRQRRPAPDAAGPPAREPDAGSPPAQQEVPTPLADHANQEQAPLDAPSPLPPVPPTFTVGRHAARGHEVAEPAISPDRGDADAAIEPTKDAEVAPTVDAEPGPAADATDVAPRTVADISATATEATAGYARPASPFASPFASPPRANEGRPAAPEGSGPGHGPAFRRLGASASQPLEPDRDGPRPPGDSQPDGATPFSRPPAGRQGASEAGAEQDRPLPRRPPTPSPDRPAPVSFRRPAADGAQFPPRGGFRRAGAPGQDGRPAAVGRPGPTDGAQAVSAFRAPGAASPASRGTAAAPSFRRADSPGGGLPADGSPHAVAHAVPPPDPEVAGHGDATRAEPAPPEADPDDAVGGWRRPGAAPGDRPSWRRDAPRT